MAVRVEATLALLAEGYDFVHLHTKRTDMAGHKKDPARKAEIIAAVDRALAPLVPLAERGEVVVVVCPDHQTPSAGPLYHGGGAVPLTIAGGVAGADGVDRLRRDRCDSRARSAWCAAPTCSPSRSTLPTARRSSPTASPAIGPSAYHGPQT